MTIKYKFLAAAVALGCAGVALAQKGETVKMVRIDPLTGPAWAGRYQSDQGLPIFR